MIVFDKAKWQIDGGIDEDLVVNHFQLMFSWLDRHEMLSEDGEEELEFGIDDSASLNDELVTSEGSAFLDKCYDKLLKIIDADMSIYGTDATVSELDKLYVAYMKGE